MPIRADILSQLADTLAELYPDQASARAIAMTAGLTLGQIPFDPKASNTWVFLLTEAEAQGRTQVLLDRVSAQYATYQPLASAGRTYADWITAGRPMAQPVIAPRRLLPAPPPPETFAGRTVELQSLTEVLLRTTTAAISAAVPGMGGVGKTTLALKLASDLAPHFPGGVVWLEAGYGAGQSDLVDRLARTLGIDLAQEPLVEKRASILQSVLADRGRVFVILDDLWDIDLGRWAGRVLLPADRVLLVTSRDLELCRALCRHVQRLDVLPEPEAMQLLGNLLGELGQYEAAGREVVKLLDGHPLALEITAGRCFNGASDLPWVLRRLRASPTLGELKLPGQESRESSVEMSLALSYGDLDPDLQQRFRALGVFAPAPFDLAGLAAVWEIEADEEAEDIARQLVRRALLATEPAEAGAAPVYRQHMLLRAYAWALLEQAGELEDVAAQHIAYYEILPGQEAENWQVAEISWEQIEQGWQHARRSGPDTALDYYYALRSFLGIRALHAAHIEWASTLLELPPAQTSNQDHAVLLTNLASVHSALGDKLRELEFQEQALALRRQVGDKEGEAGVLNDMGLVYADLGNKARALELYEQALALMRAVGDKDGEAGVLNNMGLVYAELGDKALALELYEQALSLMRAVGNLTFEANALTNMGRVYNDLGEKPRALDLYEQALALRRQIGDKAGEAITLHSMGSVYEDLDDKPRALEFHEQALALRRQVGDKVGEARDLNNMGNVYYALGDKTRALKLYEQALPLMQAVGNPTFQANTLANMGSVYDDLGEKPRALDLYEQAISLRRRVGDKHGEATDLSNIAIVYSALGDKLRALEFYERALALRRQVGDKEGEATDLSNIAIVYSALGDKLRALESHEQTLALRRQVGDKEGEAGVLNDMGLVYADLGNKARALELYEQALPLMRAVGNLTFEANALVNMGSVYDDLGDKARALELYEQALALRRQVGDKTGESITRYNIAMIYKSLDRLDEAEAQLIEVVTLDEATSHPDLESDRAMLEEVQAARRAQAADS